jgi:hypothetical protein
MTGVRRAALLAVALPPALVLLPFHAYVLGAPAALFHALNGLVMASIVVAALSHAHGKPPFISTYVPWGNMKRAAPLYAIGLTVFTFSMAAIERAAARTPFTAIVYASILLGIAMGVARAASRRARPVTLARDHRLERVTETLGLSG